MAEPLRSGVLMVGRCAWEARPGVRCGRAGVAIDVEQGRSLCAEHARATIEQRQQTERQQSPDLPDATEDSGDAYTRALKKCVPLTAWLAALPPDQESADLAFSEIEAIIGERLPPSALDPRYWSHSPATVSYWQRAGFRAHLHQHAQRVLFTRGQS
jgi:hypothetical protein